MNSSRYGRFFTAACILHAGIAVVFGVSMIPSVDSTIRPALKVTENKNPPPIVKATALDAAKVEAELARLEKAEAEKNKAQKIQAKKLAEEKAALEKAKKAQIKEEKRVAELKKEVDKLKKQAQQSSDEAKALKEKMAKEQKAIEEEKKRLAAEEKKRAEAAAKAEAIKKAEKEKAEKEKQLASEQKLKDALAKKQEQARIQSELNVAVSEIASRVSENWLRPPGSAENLQAKVRVSLLPTGAVTHAKVIESSGHAGFDRSAEAAVLKSSPFSLPADSGVIEQLRDFTFTFRPEGGA